MLYNEFICVHVFQIVWYHRNGFHKLNKLQTTNRETAMTDGRPGPWASPTRRRAERTADDADDERLPLDAVDDDDEELEVPNGQVRFASRLAASGNNEK